MSHAEQLAWERRWGRPAAAAALGAIVLVVAYQIVFLLVVYDGQPNSDREQLTALDDASGAFMAASVMQWASYLALAFVVWFLFRVTRYRRPELPAWVAYLPWAGAALFVIAGLIGSLNVIDIADEFAAGTPIEGGAGERRADALLEDRRSGLQAGLGLAAPLALAFSLVIVSLNAMRAGILNRFTGIIGIILGVLYVLPFFGGPFIVQLFWLGALAAVFLGFWPGGRGPAWSSGEAQPWPGYAESRQRAVRESVERKLGGRGPAPQGSGDGDGDGPARRKRKRRT